KFFQAVVSFIGTDGTLYIKPKSFEIELNKLMTEIQRNFKYFALPEPHWWKKGEACLIISSDNRWHRGKVVELGDGALMVQYVDSGCIEEVPPCCLYPTTLYTDIPPFCIPCQLYKTAPIGNVWKLEAIQFLQDLLLTDQEVGIHVQELPDNPWGKISVSLYLGEISVASFMAYQKYCIAEDSQDILQLEQLEGYDFVWLSYVLPPLPIPGDVFPVKVTHLVSPNKVCVSLHPCKQLRKLSATERDASCGAQWESLDEALLWCSENVESIPPLTRFQREMPCLAEYHDGFWYRAKFISVEKSDPVMVLVQFVDYGNFSVVSASRLRQMPYEVLKYPVEAVEVVLAGFKPALNDKNVRRIPYAPEWSEKALWAMIDCVEGKQLSACILALSPEITIYLYDDEKNLVHMKLIEMGLAELDE
ncbi:RNF17 protein, partial [Ceuthmochares aereus]|nr:RNF17 protein [Ceuthmochares aereus]